MSPLRVSKEHWEEKAQPGELDFHKRDKFRPSGGLEKETDSLFRGLGFYPEQYKGKFVIDAGCGSKLRTKFFLQSHIVGIDPLASAYSDIEWSNLSEAYRIYSVPLEDNIAELNSLGDLVISINVLDHCFDFESCVRNLYNYTHETGLCFLSFDEHKGGMDAMHPLDLYKEYCDQVFREVGFIINKFSDGRVYGHGTRSLNYWLNK